MVCISKNCGIKLCQALRKQYGFDAISLMPTNLYGPGDNYNLSTSHVLPALVRKFYEGKINNSNEVICWGTGKPRREFLHVDDLAESVIYVLKIGIHHFPMPQKILKMNLYLF